MKQVQVIARHRAPDRRPIRIEPGDRITFGGRGTERPQFAWTDLAAGLGSGDATALQSHDTRELDADDGERLLLHHERAACWWARNNHGTRGWIPARVLRILDDSDHPET